jgi:S-adenosylmethionine/arginine decarboxylase-like enzyme
MTDKNYEIMEFRIVDRMEGVDPALLSDPYFMFKLLLEAAELAEMIPLNANMQFYPRDPENPQFLGISYYLTVSASHLDIHTYSKEGFCTLTVAVCKEIDNARKAYEHIRGALKPAHCEPVETAPERRISANPPKSRPKKRRKS